jgi:hypothetical protein
MRKTRLIVAAIAVIATVGFAGAMVVSIYDPDAPRRSWPLLESAKVATTDSVIDVGPNVRISSQFDGVPFVFCDIASDPSDESRLFASSLCWRNGDVDFLGFYSHDGGVTWETGCELVAAQGRRQSDHSVAFGPDGEIFLASNRIDPNDAEILGTSNNDRTEFRVSKDGGKTWAKKVVLSNNIDRPWITVDTTNGQYRGNLYFHGNVNEPICYVSSDLAQTMSGPVLPRAGDKFFNHRQTEPVVGADGSVVIVGRDNNYRNRHRPKLHTYRSTDGGLTYEERSLVNTKWWHGRILSSTRAGGTVWPRLASDNESSEFSGRIYCVWGDGTVIDLEDADRNGIDGERIFFSSSSDYGLTWTQPIVLSEQSMTLSGESGEYMSFKPSIAVNKSGAIAVSWYDRRGLAPPGRQPTGKYSFKLVTDGWNVRVRVSLDGGTTWLPSVQVNEKPGRGLADVGHAAGISASAEGRFHPVWIDNRNGTKQLWTAAITVGTSPDSVPSRQTGSATPE